MGLSAAGSRDQHRSVCPCGWEAHLEIHGWQVQRTRPANIGGWELGVPETRTSPTLKLQTKAEPRPDLDRTAQGRRHVVFRVSCRRTLPPLIPKSNQTFPTPNVHDPPCSCLCKTRCRPRPWCENAPGNSTLLQGTNCPGPGSQLMNTSKPECDMIGTEREVRQRRIRTASPYTYAVSRGFQDFQVLILAFWFEVLGHWHSDSQADSCCTVIPRRDGIRCRR